MQTIKSIFILILITGSVIAQEAPLTISPEETGIHFGLEVDALPYLFGGYYASAWTGINNFRFRAIVTKINQPEFVTKNGFEDLSTNAYTFLIDYFPWKEGKQYSGWWIGAGVEYWDNNVTYSNENVSGDFDNYILTLGAGYVIKIWKNFYVNPWGAFHLRVGGDKTKQISSGEYESSLMLPEVSVKLGWYF